MVVCERQKEKVSPEHFLPPGCGSPESLGNELLFGLLTFIQVSSEKLYKIQYIGWVVIKVDTLVAYVNGRDTCGPPEPPSLWADV